jgi:Holliday junction resolvase RusA-like endonuclease
LTSKNEDLIKEEILPGPRMLIFEIDTIPKPQKQTKFSYKGAYDPSKEYKNSIQWQMKPYAPKNPILGPVRVHLTFLLPIPIGTSKIKKRQMINGICVPWKRPDLDNLAYTVTNAMQNVIYEDDSQIIDLVLSKRYAEMPKIIIKVLEMDLAKNYEDQQY